LYEKLGYHQTGRIDRVPEYFVELKRLPLNANGKVDKMALPNVLRKVAA
jgi:hypothetical protein